MSKDNIQLEVSLGCHMFPADFLSADQRMKVRLKGAAPGRPIHPELLQHATQTLTCQTTASTIQHLAGAACLLTTVAPPPSFS